MSERLDDSMQLSSLYLSCRTANCLKNEGIFTVGQVRAMTDDQLLKIGNFGRVSLREIRHITEQHMAFMAENSAEKDAARLAQLRRTLAEFEGGVDRMMTKLGAIVDAYRDGKPR